MSDPATPTTEQRAATRQLAARIVESVRADEAMALGLDDYRVENARGFEIAAVPLADVEDLVMRLAMEIEMLRGEPDALFTALDESLGLADTPMLIRLSPKEIING